MNTKIIMTTSAVLLGTAGIILTFLPIEIIEFLDMEASKPLEVLLQILGALYFAFGMLNWMTKSSLIGGIYNRPIAVANFSHFMIGGLALVKAGFSNVELPMIIWVLAIVYAIFGLVFGAVLFRHPVNDPK